MSTPRHTCHYCATTDREMRPYGPGGSWICFPCAKATPEREAAAGSAFAAQLEAAEAMSPHGMTVATPDGPAPFTGGAL